MIPLIMSVLYVWAQLNRDMIVSFWFGTRFKVRLDDGASFLERLAQLKELLPSCQGREAAFYEPVRL